MILDTDVLVWYLRGNRKAKAVVENLVPFSISAITYMELLQGMMNKEESKLFQRQMLKWNTKTLQVDQEISARAMFYFQAYAMSHSLRMADAFIAATVVQHCDTLFTANDKHYRFIPNMSYKKFVPN